MAFIELRFLGACGYLKKAIACIEERGLCKNMYLDPYSGRVSASGALLCAFGVKEKDILTWSGDLDDLALMSNKSSLARELFNLLEGVVDEDLEIWNDISSQDEVTRAFRRLINLIEISVT